MSESEIEITRRQTGKLHYLPSGKHHKIRVKTKYVCHMLEVEDLNFHHDSAVMLPDYGTSHPQEGTTPEQERITGLAVLYACYRHARTHPDQSAIVVGHTDRSGASSYNQTLSELRADNVLFALKGDREGWVNIALQKSKVEDYQQILIWLTHSLGWNCDPGSKNNVHDAPTRQAVEDFQRQYNDRFSASISVDGGVGRETWRAFFDVYMQELQYALGTDEAGLAEAQQSLSFMQCEAIGCGEEFPVTPDRQENYKSAIDRRVEILFFDPGEEPTVNCGAPRGACVELYEKKMYCVVPIPVDPLPLPSGVAVHVQLQFFYKDPDPSGNDRTFPKDCPVTIVFADGSSEQKQLGQDGTLDFFVLREKQAFTVRFQFGQVQYIASPPPTILEPDQLVAESGVDQFIKDNKDHRVFKLPQDWRLAESTWQVTGTTAFDTSDHHFKPLDDQSITNIGSAATPVKLLLDPKWQYLRFEFFDRVFGHDHHNHKRVAIPPVLLEGFQRPPAGGTPTPDTRSNWTIRPDDLEKACQCLPWILQSGPQVTGGAKPDNQILIQFRTDANSFIHSTDQTTRVVEVVTDPDKLKPGPDRLKLYDLPVLWKSAKYFTRRVGATGDFFENLTTAQVQESLNPDKFFAFSLDDMVLTNASRVQQAIGATDKVVLFFHQFKDPGVGGPFTPQGIYKPGADTTQVYFPFSDIAMPVRSYISDYPDWTRVVLAQGNLFDVFGERTAEVAGNDVVGARAAVRWVDSVAAGATPGNTLNPRPGRSDSDADLNKRFFSLQPFFAQDEHPVRARDLATGTYQEWASPVPSFPGFFTGRFDMGMLRCADVKDGAEIAVNMQYFRFHLDFTSAPAAINQASYKRNMLSQIPIRWNGPDGSNPGTIVFKPQAAGGPPLNVKPFWFVQDVPQPRAHFRVNVISIPRANMNGSTGIGNFSTGNDMPSGGGSFIAAHEAGHGGSLPDEYNERWSSCSYEFPGFGCNVPADPYSHVRGPLMMEGTNTIHSRYFWHAAEWARLATTVPLQVEITRGGSTLKYKLRTHPSAPARSFTHFPLFIESNASVGARGRFDLYLFQLGEDAYRSAIHAGKTYDGILVILVKMRFAIPDATIHNHIVQSLQSIQAKIDTEFNNKFQAAGDVAGVHFDHCLVHFAPRFLVENLVIELSNPANVGYLSGLGYTQTPAPPPPVTPTATTATQADYTSKVNAIDTALVHPRHFRVTVDDGVTSGWASANTLNIRLDVTTGARFTLGDRFWRFFGDMVGLDLSTAAAPANVPTAATVQNNIVRRAIPGATVT